MLESLYLAAQLVPLFLNRLPPSLCFRCRLPLSLCFRCRLLRGRVRIKSPTFRLEGILLETRRM